ncbi:hypothetical protein LBMAG56_16850 [Verrucomicrobiota bacterium]|nr:hypothetical protein LBMAG56_16850 [Verrucomicrobiota bacterium]
MSPGAVISRIGRGAFNLPFCLVFAALFLLPIAATANVTLHALFTSNMVLQQGVPVTIWGWAAEGETVTVRFKGQSVTNVARAGNWSVRLTPLSADAKGADLTVQGDNRITLRNVVVGEVWLCSGQSNMERPLPESDTGAAAIAAAANPNLRLFTVARNKAASPATNVVGSWQVSSPTTAAPFSAVGYFFGRELQKTLDVPVGLICSAFSGSPAEAWMSSTYLESNPDYYRQIIVPYQQNYERYLHAKEAYDKEAARRAAAGLPPPTTPPPDPPFQPGELYNGMIAPLLPLAIRGVAWYQGEANVSRAWQYRSLFPDLITTWRTAWRQATSNPELTTMPFLAVQLAPFLAIQEMPAESAWAELREAQVLATRLPKVGLAIITDCGDPARIHPRKKEPVGMRLALAARSIAYNQPVVGTSPMFRSLTLLGPRAVLAFDGVGGGLQWRGAATAGFAICGEDRRFVWATTVELQTNNTIVVSHPAVPNPVAVRYGWADYPTGTLWSSNGLPASPFRTDTFPLTTEPASDLAPIAGLGTALTFDGEGHVEIGQPPFAGTNADFTIELWAKNAVLNDGLFHGLIGREAPTGTLGVDGRSPSLWLAPADGSLHYDSVARAGGHASGYLPGFFQGVNSWVHIAWVKEGASYRFYRNGNLVGTRPAPAQCYVDPSGYNIGRAAKSFWKGSVDLVRVWCAARTPEQVRDDMYRHLVGNEAGLMASWAFDEGSGFIVDDGSQRKNWGSLRGNATFTLDTPPVVFTTRMDTVVSGSLPAVFNDGKSVIFIPTKPPSSGQLLLDFNGNFRYRPAIGVAGRESFEYLVLDASARRSSSAAIATIQVLDSNSAPLAGFGSGVSVDGAGAVELTQSPFASGTTNFTIEVWVKNRFFNDGQFYGIAGFETAGTNASSTLRSPSLFLAPLNGGLHFDIVSARGERYANFIWGFFETNAAWVHVAWVKAGNQSRFYRNGVLIAQRPAPTQFYLDPAGYSLGRVGKSAWRGSLEQVKIWNTARTDTEVAQDLFRGIQGTEPGLGGAWNFDEGTGHLAADASRNRNHGMLSGTVAFTGEVPVITFATIAGQPVSGFLPASDLNGNTLLYGVVAAPTNGTLQLNADGSFLYQPRAGFVGAETFTYRVSDGLDFSNTAAAGILVRPAPAAAGSAKGAAKP